MTNTQKVGVSLLLDHARRDNGYTPRHCACRGCRLGSGHVPRASA
jgi:hypothetical protein